jgi:acyl-CoA synthetase (AMP-forming)/AMP-acid ligase II
LIATPESATIGDVFFQAVRAYCTNSLIAVPANPRRSYAAPGIEISYAEAGRQVTHLIEQYKAAGYGVGHRAGLLLENRPEHLLHKLALNAIGVCCVPLNPDHRSAELAYVLDHAKLDFVVVLSERLAQLNAARDVARHVVAAVILEAFPNSLPPAVQRADSVLPNANTPACVLYTSGTTGRPKGCVLTHRYELAAGAWYATRGGLASLGEGVERLYNPLPLFHVNASILSFYCMLLTGNCQVQTDRFQPSRWWAEVRESRATIVHYLGVIVSLLLQQPPSGADQDHCVRFGFGAGVEPQLHEGFEQRFGFPLLEIWGMTEMVRTLVDCEAPRQVGTRAFGRPKPGLEAQVVDELGNVVEDDEKGELVIRHSEAAPRRDFFSGYLDDEAATESAWFGGWFHTGDVVTRDATGMLHYVDRRKNIIRRSGENIAAAEVEAVLLTHPWVEQVAVIAVPDELREEEVMACVVLNQKGTGQANALSTLFDYCMGNLAYYKAPGWLLIADHIPTTGTQKIQKHLLFAAGEDPRDAPGIVDKRALKKRTAQ